MTAYGLQRVRGLNISNFLVRNSGVVNLKKVCSTLLSGGRCYKSTLPKTEENFSLHDFYTTMCNRIFFSNTFRGVNNRHVSVLTVKIILVTNGI